MDEIVSSQLCHFITLEPIGFYIVLILINTNPCFMIIHYYYCVSLIISMWPPHLLQPHPALTKLRLSRLYPRLYWNDSIYTGDGSTHPVCPGQKVQAEKVIMDGRRVGDEVRKYKEHRGGGGGGEKLKEGERRTWVKWAALGGRTLTISCFLLPTFLCLPLLANTPFLVPSLFSFMSSSTAVLSPSHLSIPFSFNPSICPPLPPVRRQVPVPEPSRWDPLTNRYITVIDSVGAQSV